MENNKHQLRILTIDIGGSSIKATVLDQAGQLQADYIKAATPSPASPENVLDVIQGLVQEFQGYDRVSVGFPGYVKEGVVMTAPNLGTALWREIDLRQLLMKLLVRPVRVVNDADLQGLGVVSGNGLEMVITLGTGFGTALMLNGFLLPHLELAHHPVTKHRDYDAYIGDVALEEAGLEKWNKRMRRVLQILRTVFNYDHLYISGGNADEIVFELEENITIVSNKDGIKGGAMLWKDEFIVLSS
ncbi:ROK family protein [Pontibacter sp. E15-1]|uniref:ROK family protein n=1 Tax=Pontibacter sp. E15-1 TaxID=2919918 RepID=UPI001F503ADA|nr:ROK family protein [Pontibacter sp. E15-1]MCJ8167605.1 ROK family protein [Pontibacter sp. E15-1]